MAKAPDIDYENLVHESLREVVKAALKQVEVEGLPGNHHFYISFRTDYPGVVLPDYIKEEYPEEITIVLQYEFWDLKVSDTYFTVTVSFNDEQETLVVPFLSLVGFVDPSVKFGLQFPYSPPPIPPFTPPPSKDDSSEEEEDNIVSLDWFRSKKNT